MTDDNGQEVYGDWVRVLLVTEAFDIPGLDRTVAEALVERTSRINRALKH